MAKLKKGILGPVSGKLGNVVGATWKDISYLRERPKRKKKKQPRTQAQLDNQKKFKFIQQWLVPFYPYLNIGFANMAVDKTEINAAFSANYKQAFSGIWPDIEVDYSKVWISVGDLPGLHHPEIELTSQDTVKLSWQKSLHPNASFNDQLMLVLYCPELKVTDGFIGGIKRNAMECSFTFNQQLEGKVLEIYVSITTNERKQVANSIYMGRIEP